MVVIDALDECDRENDIQQVVQLLADAQVLRTLRFRVDLHSILDIPKDPSCQIRLHHPSFRDFLLDERKCSDAHFLVDEKKAQGVLADRCIRLMADPTNGLREDILWPACPRAPLLMRFMATL